MRTVEIIGKFFDNHSLSIINRKLAFELAKRDDIDLYINALDTYDSQYNVASADIKELKKLMREIPQEPDIQIRHSYPPIWRWPVSEKTKILQIQPWEYRKVPFEWQYKFETFVDLVITPSQWTGKVFAEAGLNPHKVAIIPNGYSTKHFNTRSRKPNEEKYQFVFVGCAQWRKGLDVLLQAWSGIFKKEDPVKLVVKDNPAVYGDANILPQLIKLQYDTGCAEIEYIGKQVSEIDMSRLYKSSHCIVHPYRGEGFGMHIQEAMACGCFPLVSGDGPTTEFVKDAESTIKTNHILVNASDSNVMMMKPGDALTTMGGHAVASQPDVQDLALRMKEAFTQRKEGRDYTNDLFTWENVAERYAGVINSIDLEEPAIRLQTQGWRAT